MKHTRFNNSLNAGDFSPQIISVMPVALAKRQDVEPDSFQTLKMDMAVHLQGRTEEGD